VVLFLMSKPPLYELRPWHEKDGDGFGASGAAKP
jgi:hypothetical protein